MINEVLDFSRIESGNLAISLEPVAVSEVLRDAIDLVQPIAHGAGIPISIEDGVCAKIYVMADRQRLVQVFINLLNNAVKYNRAGGKVAVRCEERSDETRRIEIEDTGHGISEGDMDLLFQPFHRFGDTRIEGTGLGLALSHRFMRLMGGELGLSKSSADGSTFYVDLRKAEARHKELKTPADAPLSRRSADSLSRKVLYIEDNLSNMRLLENVFGDWTNYTLIPAPQGRLGLELARELLPDLILLDQHLPDLKGDEVLKRLKADPTTRSIPVVMVSADATAKQIEALRAGGAIDYLTKPIDLRALFAVLEEDIPDKA
jgi:CheY-like chemotaxis protein